MTDPSAAGTGPTGTELAGAGPIGAASSGNLAVVAVPSPSATNAAGAQTSVAAVTIDSSSVRPAGGEDGGLVKVDLAAGGAAVEAAGGTVKLDAHGVRGQEVVLSLPTLDVRHLVGQAYGTIAANRGNDVVIDTSTIINLDLQNATPLNVGSAMIRVENLGLDAAAALGGR